MFRCAVVWLVVADSHVVREQTSFDNSIPEGTSCVLARALNASLIPSVPSDIFAETGQTNEMPSVKCTEMPSIKYAEYP